MTRLWYWVISGGVGSNAGSIPTHLDSLAMLMMEAIIEVPFFLLSTICVVVDAATAAAAGRYDSMFLPSVASAKCRIGAASVITVC